jgi:hypothetical protein
VTRRGVTRQRVGELQEVTLGNGHHHERAAVERLTERADPTAAGWHRR